MPKPLSYPAASNRVSTVVTGVTTTRTFVHDAAGNIITDTRSGSAFTYSYTLAGAPPARRARPSRHREPGRQSQGHVHLQQPRTAGLAGGDEQRRVFFGARLRHDGTVHTVQDRSGNVIAEFDGTTGIVAKEYIWLLGAGYAGTDLPVGVVDVAGTATPELLYVHADHLGRPIRLTDPAKVTAWAVEWLPWGGVHTISGSETLNARFPGQWFQVESGLHYNWHRHYDPSLGRYTQPDPLGFVDGPSVYAYARNAPGELVDLEGEQARGPTRGGRPTPPGNPRQTPAPGTNQPPQTVPPVPGGGRQCTEGNPTGRLGQPEVSPSPTFSGPRTDRTDVTRKSANEPSFQTNITRQQFEQNLQSNGFAGQSITPDITRFTRPNDTMTFTTRSISSSSGPSADVRLNGVKGSPDFKIRFSP